MFAGDASGAAAAEHADAAPAIAAVKPRAPSSSVPSSASSSVSGGSGSGSDSGSDEGVRDDGVAVRRPIGNLARVRSCKER
jgi:hypothetical protein